jgi:hypothetical protein
MKHYQLSCALTIMALVCCMHSKTFSQTDWHITGNSGTNANNNFIGTIDNQALSFRTNNALRMRISATGSVGIGIGAPVQKLDVNGNINIGKGFFLFMENHRVLRIDSIAGNTLLGVGSGSKNASSYNTATGFQSLFSNTSGSSNTANGYQALYSNYAGYANTATGSLSLYLNSTGAYNTAYGNGSLFLNTTGSYNTALGTQSLNSNSTGTENVGVGENALYRNVSGSYNTATGTGALFSNTASYNTAHGYNALFNNTSGYDNAASGWASLYSNTTGVANTAYGMASHYSNIYGSYNTAVGDYALYNTSYSNNNTAIGDIAGASFQNGWNNTFIGSQADATMADIYNSIAIGNVSRVSAPNQVRIGNSYTTSIGGYAGWSTISDGRVKKNIKDNVPGLAFINKLKAVTYNLDLDVADKFLQTPALKQKDGKVPSPSASPEAMAARQAKQQIIYTGFIAQDVEKAAKELNYDFSGVDAAKNDKDLYGLRYDEFVVPLVKAVQELSKQNEEMKKEIEEMKTAMGSQALNTLGTASAKAVTITDASLGQNTPNPFNRSTSINYTLPQKYSNAQLIITDNSGRTVKQVSVSGAGKGVVNIDASTLSSGTYYYSLVVDGKPIGSKQMVLAK